MELELQPDNVVPEKPNLICPNERCHKSFLSQLSLILHLKVCKANKNYPCSVCPKIYYKLSNLNRHLLVHTEERPFKCNDCGKTFSQKCVLTTHIRLQHNIIEVRYACKICPEVFAYKGNLIAHQRTVHTNKTEELQKLFSCPFCSSYFKSFSKLSLHHAKCHQNLTDEQKIQNTIKDVIMDLKPLNDHSGVNENPLSSYYNAAAYAEKYINGVRWYKCKECDRIFKKPYEINRHAEIHKTGGPHKCTVCPETFRLRTLLILHYRSVHNNHNNSLVIQNKKTANESIISDKVAVTPNSDDVTQFFDLMDYAKNSDYQGKFEMIKRELFDDVVNSPTGGTQMVQENNLHVGHEAQQNDNAIVSSQNVPVVDISSQPFGEHVGLQELQINADGQYMNCLEFDSALANFSEEVQSLTNTDPVLLNELESIDQPEIHMINPVDQSVAEQMNETKQRDMNHTKSILNYAMLEKTTENDSIIIPDKTKVKAPKLTILSVHKVVRSGNVISLTAINDYVNSVPKLNTTESPNNFQCQPERNNLSTAYFVIDPSQKYSGKVNRYHKCIYCQAVYKRQSDLSIHTSKHINIKSFRCNMCDKSFSFLNALRTHEKIHSNRSENYPCKICHKNFLSKGGLVLHGTKHSQVLNYECSICQEKFRTSGLRINHIKKIHTVSENPNTEQKKSTTKKKTN